MSIRNGSRVRMAYRLSFAKDGSLIEEDDALEFTVGDGSIMPALELALMGLTVGDEQELVIPPESGFGFRDPEQIHNMPMVDFPEELLPEVGQVISFDLPNGDDIPGTIVSVNSLEAEVDFNHPLAGYDLTFWVNIQSVDG